MKPATHSIWGRMGLVLTAVFIFRCDTNKSPQQPLVSQFLLTVSVTSNRGGDGTGGTVTSNPPGIDCRPGAAQAGQTCSSKFDSNASVTLTATPADDTFQFDGWENCSTATTPSISVVMTADKTCRAKFSKMIVAITAEVSSRDGLGTGGSVTSNPSGITCPPGRGQTCTASFDKNSSVVLTAQPADSSFSFRAWSNCSTASDNPLTVTADTAKTCRANFAKLPVTITAEVSSDRGFGIGGRVTTNPSGITCPPGDGQTCSAAFDRGSPLQLTATPADPTFLFSSWSGCATSESNPLALTVDQPTTCRANFIKIQFAVTVEVRSDREGVAGGSVTSDPTGLTCPPAASCTATFDSGTRLSLIARPSDSTFVFSDWSGCTSSTENPLTITVDRAMTCRANFTKVVFQVSTDLNPDRYGSVTSNPSRINCTQSGAPACRADFDSGASVTLTATADTSAPNPRRFLTATRTLALAASRTNNFMSSTE